MSKKNLKTLIIGIGFVVLIVGYYTYLSNKTPDTEQPVFSNEEVGKLVSRNLEGMYYPEFPRSVVEFYSRIVVAYYYTPLEEEEIEALGAQARKLFDEELLEKNPEEQFYEDLKLEIAMYNERERKVYSYTVEDASDIRMFTFDGQQYAQVSAAYLMREKNQVVNVYHDYTLRKDADGNWKILFWEKSDVIDDE